MKKGSSQMPRPPQGTKERLSTKYSTARTSNPSKSNPDHAPANRTIPNK